jgi:peptide chain release factor 1
LGADLIDVKQIRDVLGRLEAVEAALGDPDVLQDRRRYRATLSDHAFLKRLEAAFSKYERAVRDIASSRELMDDPDFREEAEKEVAELESKLDDFERGVLAALLKPDPFEERNAVMEIRAGTGGEEAALFAGNLFRMYSRYCESRGWKISVMHANATSLDGYKEVVFTVLGEGAYGVFRFESGGHRVQRVPETEAQGRIHTSAATVIVLPEADEEDDLVIPESELRVDIFCAGGHGGQGVNTTYSAIRITHLQTGLVAQCQDERSQHRNKEKALAVLKSRILDAKRQEEAAKVGATRLTLRGSGDRSQRIRTYNFPQNRMTDHRVNLTLYSLDRIMEGELDDLFREIDAFDLQQRFEAALGANH